MKKIINCLGYGFGVCFKYYLFFAIPTIWIWFPFLAICRYYDTMEKERKTFFGKVFVEYWDGQKWGLSAVKWWQYLLMRLWGYCGDANADVRFYDYRHVPRKNVTFTL